MNETEKVLNANLAEMMNSAIVERDETIKQLRAEVERLKKMAKGNHLALGECIEQRDQLRECAERLVIAQALWSATFQKYESWMANGVKCGEWPESVVDDYRKVSKETEATIDCYERLKKGAK